MQKIIQSFKQHPDYTLARNYLICFSLAYVMLWSLVPYFLRFELPMDTLEAVSWSQNLAWGYDRNPYLNAWIARFFVELGQGNDWFLYLAARLLTLLCFYSIWRLAHYFITPLQTVAAILSLHALTYFSFSAIELNDNLLELAFWPWMIWLFYEAIQTQKIHYWLLTGFAAGLSLMSKYYSAVPITLLFIYLLANRELFNSKGFLLALATCLLVCAPHIHWLYLHDFVTISYTQGSMRPAHSWQLQLWQPIDFLLKLALSLILPVLMLRFATPFNALSIKFDRLTTQQRQFLYLVVFGPILITALISLITGSRLRTSWGQPLLSLCPLLLLSFSQPDISRAGCKRLLIASSLLILLTLTAYGISMQFKGQESSANFPGADLAMIIEDTWHEHYAQPLPYIIGERRLSGSIAHYSQDKPMIYLEMNQKYSPHINESDIHLRGGIVVWKAYMLEQGLPEDVKTHFPQAKHLKNIILEYKRITKNDPMLIGIALIKPQN